jgi:outer membrane cobalamin receptor
MGNGTCPNFDVNAAGKITVIKGASGLQYGGDAVGGLVVIEPISVKGHAVWQNHSEFGVQWQRRFLVSSA